MRYFLLVCVFSFFLIACQKEINFDTGLTPPTTTVRCTSCSYLPVCDSTRLTYVDSTLAGVDTTASTLLLIGDTTIAGRKFNRVTPFAAFKQGLLYNCDGGDYRIYQAVPNLGLNIDSLLQGAGLPFPTSGITLPSRIQTTILKSGAAAGATWSDTVFTYSPLPIFSVVAKLDYKLEEKGVQRIVLGKTYTEVIHVSSKLNVVAPLVTIPVNVSIDYYFANNIGIIEAKAINNGIVQNYTRLLSYRIK